MYIILGALLLCVLFLYILFVSRRFSPIPYIPTDKKDIPLIVKASRLKNDQLFVDLGAGDGRIIFGAAREAHKRKLSTRFLGVETNLLLLLVMQLRRLFNPGRSTIAILYANVFSIDINSLPPFNSLIVYVFASPYHLQQIYTNLKHQRIPFTLITYFYPIKHLAPYKIIKGKHYIYLYKVA